MENNTIKYKKISISIILWVCAILIGPICDSIAEEIYRVCTVTFYIQLIIFIGRTFARNLAYLTIGYTYCQILHIQENTDLKAIWNKKIFIRLLGIQLIASFIQLLILQFNKSIIMPIFIGYPLVIELPYIMVRIVDFAILIGIVRFIEIEFFNKGIKNKGYIWKDKRVIVIVLLCSTLPMLVNCYLYKILGREPLMGIHNLAQLLSLFKIIDLQNFSTQICESLVFMYAVYRQWKIHNI